MQISSFIYSFLQQPVDSGFFDRCNKIKFLILKLEIANYIYFSCFILKHYNLISKL